MTYSAWITPTADDSERILRRRLDSFTRMPLPAKGSDSQRRIQNLVETLTALQNERYIARLGNGVRTCTSPQGGDISVDKGEW